MPENNAEWKEVNGKVPPLSALLDLRVPVVEVEADRLHAAMSWLYTAVQKLQQQQVATSGEVQQLQEQSKRPTQVDVPVALPEDLKLMLQQHEQRRLGDVAQTELRLHGLRSSVDGCLKSSDLEALRERLSRELAEVARSCKEELASLARLVHRDAQSERQQLQDHVQALRTKVESQLDLVARELGRPRVETVERPQAGYQEPAPQHAEEEEEETAAPPAPAPVAAPEVVSPPDRTEALQSRVQHLEAAIVELRGNARSSSQGQELDPRIMQRFTDMDKAHLSSVQRFAQMEQRLMRVETSVPMGAGPKAKATGDWKAPFDELQSSHSSLAEELKASSGEVSTLRSALTELTRYVSGEQPEGPSTSAVQHNKLQWLEQRINQLVAKRKGLTIEKRLQLLEEVTGSQEMLQRLQSVEHLLGKLDVDAVKEVPPQLIIVKEDQETFKQDLRREVQELKVLVGCMEACVPKETRKAIQLFKRGAGAPDEEFISPEELKAHAELIALREDIQGQLGEMEMNSAQRYDNMSAQLQELEMKQEKVEHLVKKSVEAPGDFVAPEGWQR